MPGKKHGKTIQHRSYRGPWPEEHTAVPGQPSRVGRERTQSRTETPSQPPQVHKIPPPAPK